MITAVLFSLLLAARSECPAAPQPPPAPAEAPCAATTYIGHSPALRTFTWRDTRGRLLRLDRDQDADGGIDDRTWILRNEIGRALHELSDENGDGAVDRVTSYVWANGELVERCRMSWPSRVLQLRLVRTVRGNAISEELDEDGDGNADERREILHDRSSVFIRIVRAGAISDLLRSRRGRTVNEVRRSADGSWARALTFDGQGLRTVEVDHEADGVIDAREEIARRADGRIAARRFFDGQERAPRAEVLIEYGSFGVSSETWSERRDGELEIVRVVRYDGSCVAPEPDRLTDDLSP
jgi:hypothetical protein